MEPPFSEHEPSLVTSQDPNTALCSQRARIFRASASDLIWAITSEGLSWLKVGRDGGNAEPLRKMTIDLSTFLERRGPNIFIGTPVEDSKIAPICCALRFRQTACGQTCCRRVCLK